MPVAEKMNPCPECGAPRIEYRIPLIQRNVAMLRHLRERGPSRWWELDEAFLASSRSLTHLQHWNFIRYATDEQGKERYGVWECTPHGSVFLDGLVAVPAEVRTYRGDLVSVSDKLIYVDDVPNMPTRQREDYLADAQPHEEGSVA